MKISFCTTCMNRLYNLKETFPKNLEITKDLDVEFCLVNYDSKDKLDEWIHDNYQHLLDSGRLKYLYERGHKYFEIARAKNLSHQLATGDIVVTLDADNYITQEFIDMVNDRFEKSMDYYLFGSRRGSGGRVVISRENFNKLDGYDEQFSVYGYYEHIDLKERADSIGLTLEKIPYNIMPFIEQSDVERFKNYKKAKTELRDMDRRYKIKRMKNNVGLSR